MRFFLSTPRIEKNVYFMHFYAFLLFAAYICDIYVTHLFGIFHVNLFIFVPVSFLFLSILNKEYKYRLAPASGAGFVQPDPTRSPIPNPDSEQYPPTPPKIQLVIYEQLFGFRRSSSCWTQKKPPASRGWRLYPNKFSVVICWSRILLRLLPE